MEYGIAWVAVAASLQPFFTPRTVAVVGASSRRGSIGGELFRNILDSNFTGVAYPVNPNAPSVAGVEAYPSAADLPSFEGTITETPSPVNPLGFKGIAESGTIGAPPALQNAVVDALSHLGVRHIDMPLTPARLWTAIRNAKRQ